MQRCDKCGAPLSPGNASGPRISEALARGMTYHMLLSSSNPRITGPFWALVRYSVVSGPRPTEFRVSKPFIEGGYTDIRDSLVDNNAYLADYKILEVHRVLPPGSEEQPLIWKA